LFSVRACGSECAIRSVRTPHCLRSTITQVNDVDASSTRLRKNNARPGPVRPGPATPPPEASSCLTGRLQRLASAWVVRRRAPDDDQRRQRWHYTACLDVLSTIITVPRQQPPQLATATTRQQYQLTDDLIGYRSFPVHALLLKTATRHQTAKIRTAHDCAAMSATVEL